jgi:hypothetical protein
MKTIRLTKGYSTTVDDRDYELVSARKWSASVTKSGHVYAVAYIDGRNQKLHRFILNLGPRKEDGRIVDHIDGNTLNNTRPNLRICTQSQNAKNARKIGGTASRFKGAQVFQGKWGTSITADGKKHYIGLFDHEVLAAVAYNQHARVLHGDFANLNQLRYESEIARLLTQKTEIESQIAHYCQMELEEVK